jgi:hypothetical protein
MAKPQEFFENAVDVYTTPDGWTVLDFGNYEAFLSPDCTRRLIEALQTSDNMSQALLADGGDYGQSGRA